jgi:transposase
LYRSFGEILHMSLEEQNILLKEENILFLDIISKFEKHIAEQDKRIVELDNRIIELEDLLVKAKIIKDSSNSSKPPSSDISSPKRNQSLREKSEKPTGGQLGHKGTTLLQSENPDETIELNPTHCSKCGINLEDLESHFEDKRQEFDIPQVRVIVKEYRRNSKKCPRCGHRQETEYPNGITNNVQYGPNIEASVSYLSIYQYLPYLRLKEFMKHFFNIGISEGTIYNVLKRMSAKAQPIYDKIKETISQSNQVGSDETSVKIKGKKFWIWVWQTTKSTYITVSESRGTKAIEKEFPAGLEKAILNTDRWAAQLKTKAAGHQFCISHLLRELNFIEETEKIDWAERVKILLKKGLELKKQQSEYSEKNPLAVKLEQEFNILLQENIPKESYRKTYTFQKSLIKHRDSIFTFLYNKDTPPDNNGSERAIRNVKVKQKISGQFKTGEKIFCVLRSVIDTCKKTNLDIMQAMKSIALSY